MKKWRNEEMREFLGGAWKREEDVLCSAVQQAARSLEKSHDLVL